MSFFFSSQGLTVDDFERNDLSPYGYHTGNFSVTSAAGYQGNFGLEHTGSSSGGLYSTSGLPNYLERGMKFRHYWNATWSGTPAIWRVYWVAKNISGGHPDDGYRMDYGHNKQVIQKRTNGSTDSLATESWIPSENTWYYTDITWDDGSTFGGSDGDITIDFYRASDDANVLSFPTVNDTEHTGGGIGFWHSSYMTGTMYDWYYIIEK